MHVETWTCDRCGQESTPMYKKVSFIIEHPHFRELGIFDYCASCFVDMEAKIKRIIKERIGDSK